MSDGDSVPDLRCHFAGELTNDSNLPWIKFNLGRDYYVKSIKIFNLKNGFENSNLEGAKIYVGDILCATAPLVLPYYEFFEIICVDPDAEQGSFGTESNYDGAQGNSIRI